MKCTVCDTESKKGIRGPRELFICFECVESLAVAPEIDVKGKCSWCESEIGKLKGFFKRRRIRAVELNKNTGVILCNECSHLCRDIMKNEIRV